MTAIIVTLVLLSLVLLTRWLLIVVTVVGGSMEPTLRDGDRVLVLRGRSRGSHDIVLVRAPLTASGAAARPLRIKRVVAWAGEPMPGTGAPVPAGHIFVLGDHPKSEDSKQWGPIPAGSIVGFVRRHLGQGGLGDHQIVPAEVTDDVVDDPHVYVSRTGMAGVTTDDEVVDCRTNAGAVHGAGAKGLPNELT